MLWFLFVCRLYTLSCVDSTQMRVKKTQQLRYEGSFALGQSFALGYQWFLQRGHVVDLAHTTAGVASLRTRPPAQMKVIGESDCAVRKYRQDLIPNRSQSLTASISNFHSVPQQRHLPRPGSEVVLNKGGPQQESSTGLSRDCYQCSASEPTLRKMPKRR